MQEVCNTYSENVKDVLIQRFVQIIHGDFAAFRRIEPSVGQLELSMWLDAARILTRSLGQQHLTPHVWSSVLTAERARLERLRA